MYLIIFNVFVNPCFIHTENVKIIFVNETSNLVYFGIKASGIWMSNFSRCIYASLGLSELQADRQTTMDAGTA